MYFELEIAKRGRKCMCGATIAPKEKLFVLTDWNTSRCYPAKKNICLNCAKQLFSEAFIAFLEGLVGTLKANRKVMNGVPDTRPAPVGQQSV